MTNSGPESATGLACGEVRGGTTPVYDRFVLPGLRGVLYSRPCSGVSGGDIHYLSVCGSGLVSRVCVADVAGHGETIAAVGTAMHAHLLRSVDVIDERKVLTRMDSQLEASGLRAMTTAALLTYVSPSRRLTVAYAGHPPGWLYRAREKTWGALQTAGSTLRLHKFSDLPLGTGLAPVYTRHRFKVEPGDRLLLVTDGVIETTTPNDVPFDTEGVTALLNSDDCETLASRLLSALHGHADRGDLSHDDVTFVLAEIVDGPPGPALWHIIKNRLLSGSKRPL